MAGSGREGSRMETTVRRHPRLARFPSRTRGAERLYRERACASVLPKHAAEVDGQVVFETLQHDPENAGEILTVARRT